MARLTVAAAGETKTLDYTAPVEPTGADLVSVRSLGTGPLAKRMDLLAAGKGITLPPGVFSDPDMNYPPVYPVYGYYLAKPTKVLGSGVDVSVLEVKPSSLTQTYVKLDTLVEPAPNPYRIVRFDAAQLVQDLTIRGTLQGTSAKSGKPYSYHGVQFFQTVNPTLRRVHLQDVPGSQGVPPDETFSLEAYRCTGLFTVEDVLIDGPNLPGSSGVTVNGTPGALGVLLRRVTMRGHPNGSGWTTFNTKLTSWRAEDFVVDGALCGMNFEHVNVNGGAGVNNAKDSGIVIVRPDIRNPVKPTWYTHLGIDASGAAGAGGVSNRVDIYDPVGISAANPYGVTISAGYGYASVPSGPQKQRGADIHLWVNGVERRDLIRWIRTQGAP